MIQFVLVSLLCGIPAFTAAVNDSCPNVTVTGDPCGITGIWKNQLNSTMLIYCQDGSLSGRYSSAVGNAEDYYDLKGRYTMVGVDHRDCIMGWSVAYNNIIKGNSNSTCSWTGIHYANEGIIHTHWILARYRERNDLWSASLVGNDQFQRIC